MAETSIKPVSGDHFEYSQIRHCSHLLIQLHFGYVISVIFLSWIALESLLLQFVMGYLLIWLDYGGK